MRQTGPKTRFARRVGEPLRDKDVKYLAKRNYPPGMHGQSRRRMSEYGTQLQEKQKAKWIYGVAERQFRRYVESAMTKKGRTGDILLMFLEMRLDNLVYRLGFAESRAQARQLVSHGFFNVNGKRVDIPSYQVKVGEEIAVRDSKKDSKYMQTRALKLKEFEPQEWLVLEAKEMKGKVLAVPSRDNTGNLLSTQLIIEHYSR